MVERGQAIAVGIIGTGGMGRRHAHNLHTKIKGAVVAGVSDVDEARMARVAVECNGARMFNDPHALICDQDIDALLIVSPDETHAEYVLACLEQGKPVLCEKPLAPDPQDAWRVIDAETALGKRLVSVGFMRRFDPYHVAVKETVDSGAVGRPVLFRGIHRNEGAQPGLPRYLIVSGSAIHDIDSARWLLDQEVTEVFARGLRVDPALDDNFYDLLLVQLRLSGDCVGTIEAFVSARYGYEVVAEVVGAEGAATTAQPIPATMRRGQQRSTVVEADWLQRFQEAYVLELAQWVQSLRGAAFQGANAWDGYASLLVARACIESLQSGQPQAVKAPEAPALYR